MKDFICAATVLVLLLLNGVIGNGLSSENQSEKWGCSEKCYSVSSYDWLKSSCYNGVKKCRMDAHPYYGYSCICKPTPTPSALPPSPTPSSSPKPKCYGKEFDKCFPKFKKSYLSKICPYGLEGCTIYYKHYTYPGYKCKCIVPPSPSSSPTRTPTPTPTPSSSTKPKCYGEEFDKCFPSYKKGSLLRTCPYGLEDCPIYYKHYTYSGYKCKCVILPSPSSTPTRTPTPTPSSSPTSSCTGEAVKKCYRSRFHMPYCEYGDAPCDYYYGGYKKSGFKCKCAPPSPSPVYSDTSKCPLEVNTYSKYRSMEYKIDVGKTSGCINVYYYFQVTPFTIFVYYEGKTLIKDRVNYTPSLPVKLCFHGYSSTVTVKINTTLYKKIQFKVECAADY